jgi:hypothetical protein
MRGKNVLKQCLDATTTGKATSAGCVSCLHALPDLWFLRWRADIQNVSGKDIAAGAQRSEGVGCVLDHAFCD